MGFFSQPHFVLDVRRLSHDAGVQPHLVPILVFGHHPAPNMKLVH